MEQLFCQRSRNKTRLAIFASLVVLASAAEAEESSAEIQREKMAEEGDQKAQQDASLTTSQRNALETELKKVQERARLAEKNADLTKRKVSALEAALAEKDDQLETELKKAQERAQLAEKIVDLTERKLSAVEAALREKDDQLETELKKAQTAPIAVEADPASKNEPFTPDQQSVKLARFNESGSAVPLPIPFVAASMESTPPGVQADKGIRTSMEEQSSNQLVLEYSQASASEFVARQQLFFEHRVKAESSTGQITSGQATSFEQGRTVILSYENSLPWTETPDSTQAPVPANVSEMNRPNAQANTSPEPSIQRQDFARGILPKIHNIRHRSAARLRFTDVKTQLIALWRQSMTRSQKSHGRIVFSNSNKGAKKKAEYTVKTNH